MSQKTDKGERPSSRRPSVQAREADVDTFACPDGIDANAKKWGPPPFSKSLPHTAVESTTVEDLTAVPNAGLSQSRKGGDDGGHMTEQTQLTNSTPTSEPQSSSLAAATSTGGKNDLSDQYKKVDSPARSTFKSPFQKVYSTASSRGLPTSTDIDGWSNVVSQDQRRSSSQPRRTPSSSKSLAVRPSRDATMPSRHGQYSEHLHVFSAAPFALEQFVRLRNEAGDRYLDASRFQALLTMYETGESPRGHEVRNPFDIFDNFFKHCGGRMAGDLDGQVPSSVLDSLFVRCAEEVPYVRALVALIPRLQAGIPVGLHVHFVFQGKFQYHIALNRKQWGKDLYDEARLRQQRRRSDPDFRGMFISWNQIEYHSLSFADRDRLYWPLPPTWWDDFEGNRMLGVPTPPLTTYLTDLYLRSDARSVLSRFLRDALEYEYVSGYVLSHAYAAENGVAFNDTFDHRHGPNAQDQSGRLFRLAPGVIYLLSQFVHPLYFLDSTDIDPVRAFLALRRAQEFAWGETGCAPYDFQQATLGTLSVLHTVDRRNKSLFYPAVHPTRQACEMTELAEAQRAVLEFRRLTRRHHGRTFRAQPCPEVTAVLNGLGLGIESPSLQNLRVNLGSRRWAETYPVMTEAEARSALDAFVNVVSQMEPVTAEDAGVENLSWARPGVPPSLPAPFSPEEDHRDDMHDDIDPDPPETPPDSLAREQRERLSIPRPIWWPVETDVDALTASLETLKTACGNSSLSAPVTVTDVFKTANDVVGRLDAARGDLANARASERQLTTNNEAHAKTEQALRARITELEGDLDTATATANNLVEAQTDFDERLKEVRDERDDLRTERDQLRTTLQSAEETATTTAAAHANALATQLSAHQAALRAKDEAAETLQTSLRTANTTISQLRRQHARLMDANSSLTNERNTLRAASRQSTSAAGHAATELDSLRRQVTDLAAANSAFATECRNLTADKTEAETAKTAAETRATEAEQSANQLATDKAGVDGQLATAQSELTTCRGDLSKLQEEHAALETDLQRRSTGSKETNSQELGTLRGQVSSLQTQLRDASASEQRMHMRAMTAETNLHRATGQTQRLVQQFRGVLFRAEQSINDATAQAVRVAEQAAQSLVSPPDTGSGGGSNKRSRETEPGGETGNGAGPSGGAGAGGGAAA